MAPVDDVDDDDDDDDKPWALLIDMERVSSVDVSLTHDTNVAKSFCVLFFETGHCAQADARGAHRILRHQRQRHWYAFVCLFIATNVNKT